MFENEREGGALRLRASLGTVFVFNMTTQCCQIIREKRRRAQQLLVKHKTVKGHVVSYYFSWYLHTVYYNVLALLHFNG